MRLIVPYFADSRGFAKRCVVGRITFLHWNRHIQIPHPDPPTEDQSRRGVATKKAPRIWWPFFNPSSVRFFSRITLYQYTDYEIEKVVKSPKAMLNALRHMMLAMKETLILIVDGVDELPERAVVHSLMAQRLAIVISNGRDSRYFLPASHH